MKYTRRLLAAATVLDATALGPAWSSSAGAAVPAGDAIVYNANGFNKPVGTEWSDGTRSQVQVLSSGALQNVLGQFDNQKVSLALPKSGTLPAHSYLTITFQLLTLASWDGVNPPGPDEMAMSVDGAEVFHSSFASCYSQPQSFPFPSGSASIPTYSGTTTFGTYANDACFNDATYSLQYTIPHTGSSAVIDFEGFNLQGVGDEGWALDNLVVSVGNTPNQAPTATAPTKTLATHNNTPRSIDVRQIGMTTSDGDGDAVIKMLTTAEHGSLVRTGRFTYDYYPEGDFDGLDHITAYAFDGQTVSAPVTLPMIVGLPTINVTNTPEIDEKPGKTSTLKFDLELSEPIALASAAYVWTGDCGAEAPGDYVPKTSVKVAFPANVTKKSVSIVVNDDAIPEDAEGVCLGFAPPDGSTGPAPVNLVYGYGGYGVIKANDAAV